MTTGADGSFGLEGLTAGDYTATVTPPTGYALDGAASLDFRITDAGEAVAGQDFTLAATAGPPTSPSPTPSTAPPASVDPAELADTGSSSPVPAGVAALLLGAAGAMLLTVARLRRRARKEPR